MKRSILLDSGADLISYGMGEHSIVEIADALNSGLAVSDITFIDGTVYKTRKREDIYDAIELPHYEEVLADKAAYARSFIPSTAIPIRLSPNVCLKRTTESFLSCRIRRRSR